MLQQILFSPLTLIIIIILAVVSFLFSASETSIIGLSKIRLRHMVSRGVKRAQNVQRLVSKLDSFIAALLIGNNFVNVALSALITGIFVQLIGYKLGVLVSTFFTSFFILVFCEITPKLLATRHTEKTALFSAPLMEFIVKLFHPMVVVFTSISNLILRVFGLKPVKRSPLLTEEELRLMIEIGKEEGVVSDDERKMLHRIFEFGDIKVSDVMMPKEKMVAVNINFTPEELLNVFVEQGHARLPVFNGTLDNIAGIVYARDLLYILRDKGLFLLQDLLQPAFFISKDMRVHDLLQKFQAEKIQIAIVVDEQKKTLGLVTLEDLIEEIVGEIDESYKSGARK